MKKLFAFLSLALVFAACTDDDESQPAKIILSSDNPAVTIGADGKSATVALTSLEGGTMATVNFQKRTEIEVKSNSDWCAAAISGSEITILANSATETDRSAMVSINEVGGGKLGEITVNQSATPTLTLSEAVVNAASEGETRTIQITTNQAEWNATSSESWIKTATEGDKLTLTIDPNPGDDTRTAVITVTAGKAHNSIAVPLSITQHSTLAFILEYTVTPTKEDGKPRDMKVLLPFFGKVDINVSWGDGSEPESYNTTITQSVVPISHTYEEEGTYTVAVTGSVNQMYSLTNHTDDSRSFLTAIKQWGYLGVVTMENAFLNCRNLVSIPENHSNSFRETTNFKYAFQKTGIKSIPASLFKGATKVTLLTFCFSDCKITEIPEKLLYEVPDVTDYMCCFSVNSELTTIPAKLFASATKATTFASCFQLCPKLTEIPSGLFRNLTSATKITDVFYGCKALTKVPDELFAGCTSADSFSGCFNGCSALVSVGNNVFKDCAKVTSYASLFLGATALESVPVGIFDDSKKVVNFTGVFRNASKLATESPYTMVDGNKVHLYERSLNTTVFTKPTSFSGCFANCTALADWQTINTAFDKWR